MASWGLCSSIHHWTKPTHTAMVPECHQILEGFRRGRAISTLYPAFDTDVAKLHPRYRASLHCMWLKHSELCWRKRFQVTSFLRVWHWIPSHCGGQWQVLGPMHSPPFLHPWRQIAAQTSSQSLVISQVVTLSYYSDFRTLTRGGVLFMHKSHIIFTQISV